MHGEIRLDPQSLRDRAARLTELAKRMAQTHTGLQDCLARADGSWGDDYMGVAFAEQFEPNAEQLLANVRAMEESLDSTAHGIADAAGQFESQDASGAATIGATTGEPSPGIGAPILSGPDSGTSALTPTGTPTWAGTPPPAVNSGATRIPAETTAGAQPTERPAPGGNRSSDHPAGRPEQEGARRPGRPADPARREPSPARRDMDRSSRDSRVSAGPAAGPGRRSPASPVLPPPARRDTPPVQGSAPGHRPAADAGGRATPWSKPAPPASGPPTGSEASPRSGPPPRQHKPSDDKPRAPDRRSPGQRPVTDPVIGRLARELADRHGVTVIGFDTPGLQVPPVREFVGAVDRTLTDYPALAVDVVAVGTLDDARDPVRWHREPRGIGGSTRSVTLDQQTAQDPGRAAGTSEPGTGPERWDVYTATLREFGRALDVVGGGIAGRQAQRALIAEYMRQERGRHRTVGEAVRGYRDWRAELTGTDPAVLGFDGGRACGAAFAECLRYGEAAGVQARTLHAVLVGAVSRERGSGV